MHIPSAPRHGTSSLRKSRRISSGTSTEALPACVRRPRLAARAWNTYRDALVSRTSSGPTWNPPRCSASRTVPPRTLIGRWGAPQDTCAPPDASRAVRTSTRAPTCFDWSRRREQDASPRCASPPRARPLCPGPISQAGRVPRRRSPSVAPRPSDTTRRACARRACTETWARPTPHWERSHSRATSEHHRWEEEGLCTQRARDRRRLLPSHLRCRGVGRPPCFHRAALSVLRRRRDSMSTRRSRR